MAVLESASVSRRMRYVDLGLPVAALSVALVIATLARWGPDWPAQEFRAWSAHHNGLTAWTNRWYSGEALPGYSVIYPAIGSLLGAAVTGLAAVIVTYIGAMQMAPTGDRFRAVGFRVSVVIVLAADLMIGQVPYLVGVAFGVWTVWAIRDGRPLIGAVLAALSSLASPLAGAFLLIAAPAFASAYGWRRAVPLGAAGAGVAVSVLYGGAGGPFPYLSRVLAWTLIFAVAAVVLTHRLDRPLRILGLTYAPAAVLAFAVPNPIGGNLARLGQLIALPLVWHVLPRLRVGGRKWTIALVFFAALWPVFPSLTSIGKGALDPSQSRPYYTGLLGYLRTQNADSGRLEVVFTREHWESLYVAQNFPLARGWERQTDLGTNHVLYHSLSATAYRRWLDDNAVSLVALPNVPIDFGGVAERSLLQHPPSYLTPVWHDRNWKVWRVQGARGLVSGPATIRDVGAASFVLDFRRPGSATVRIRANEMWSVTRGEGCVSSSPDGWLAVSAEAAGSMTLRARVGVPSLATEKQCS